MLCQYPGCVKPVFPSSNWCGRTHRDNDPNNSAGGGGAGGATCAFPGCVKPVYQGSQYCSRSHRDGLAVPPAAASGGPTCAFPGCAKPPWTGGGAYCGRTHRDAAAALGYVAPVSPTATVGSAGPAGTGSKTCALPGCIKPAYQGSDFCGRGHRDAAGGGHGGLPGLTEIPSSDPKFADIQHQFTSKWLHAPGNAPTVRHIYRVIMPPNIVQQYETYKAGVQARGNFGDGQGNQRRRFHGTKRTCSLGDGGNTSLCSDSGCSLCCIVRTSFDTGFAGTAFPWGGNGSRFGKGVYSSSTSSKANDYARNAGSGGGFGTKAMFLTMVVVGNPHKMGGVNTGLTGPPPGYDSVIGEPGKQSINYDELIVYHNGAIIPAYVIVYDKP